MASERRSSRLGTTCRAWLDARAAKTYRIDVVFRFHARRRQRPQTTLMRLILDQNGIKRIERMEGDGVRLDPPDEILANKLNTLIGRAEECDLVDVYMLDRADYKVDAALAGAHKEVRTFGTMRRDLEGLVIWLDELRCTHVAMESSGVHWMSVYAALEGRFEIIVGDATHIKNVPDRKT